MFSAMLADTKTSNIRCLLSNTESVFMLSAVLFAIYSTNCRINFRTVKSVENRSVQKIGLQFFAQLSDQGPGALMQPGVVCMTTNLEAFVVLEHLSKHSAS